MGARFGIESPVKDVDTGVTYDPPPDDGIPLEASASSSSGARNLNQTFCGESAIDPGNGLPVANGTLSAAAQEAIKRHPRVHALRDEDQRIAIVEFAKRLVHYTEEEDPKGLYDNPGALIRYLRARKWDFEAAELMIRETGRWRKQYDFPSIRSQAMKEIITRENATGKLYVRGFDLLGRPIMYMKPHLENTKDHDGCVAHLVYQMERAVACIERKEAEAIAQGTYMDDGGAEGVTGKFCVIADFNMYSLAHAIPLASAREVVNIMQNHYPERLGQMFIIDPPWLFSALWSAVHRFLDPVTARKVQVLSEERGGPERRTRLMQTFDMATLEDCIGGDNPVPFNSQTFLDVTLGGTEFGLEYDEQFATQEQQSQQSALENDSRGNVSFVGRIKQPSAPPPQRTPEGSLARLRRAGDPPQAKAFFLVASDHRVFALPKEQRDVLRSLARSLQNREYSPTSSGRSDGASPTQVAEEYGEILFDDAGVLLRYLRACNWNERQAEVALHATARWRQRRLSKATQEQAAVGQGNLTSGALEESVGRIRLCNCSDLRGRPLIYAKLDRPGAGGDEGFVHHVLHCVDRAGERLDEKFKADRCVDVCSEMAFIVDFSDYDHNCRPSIRALREVARTLQDHYPERLAAVYLLQPPIRVRCLWTVFRRILSPKTSEKVVFVTSVEDKVKLLELATGKGEDKQLAKDLRVAIDH